jgi:hypothetical protein
VVTAQFHRGAQEGGRSGAPVDLAGELAELPRPVEIDTERADNRVPVPRRSPVDRLAGVLVRNLRVAREQG